MDAADSIRKLHFLSSVHLGNSSLLVGGPSSSTGFVVSAAHRSAEQSRQAAKVSLLWCKDTGPLGCVFVCQCLNWVLVRRRSDKLTAAIALIIHRILPTIYRLARLSKSRNLPIQLPVPKANSTKLLSRARLRATGYECPERERCDQRAAIKSDNNGLARKADLRRRPFKPPSEP